MTVAEMAGAIIGILGLFLMICLGLATVEKRKRSRRQK
jgi:hypothetical protein